MINNTLYQNDATVYYNMVIHVILLMKRKESKIKKRKVGGGIVL